MNESLKCQFRVGDQVRYSPSLRGLGHEAMTPPEMRLVPGALYRIALIQDGAYVVVDGYEHPGGGLYWTEFSSTEAASTAEEAHSRSTNNSNARNA